MSKRAQMKRQARTLHDISGIMGAMKNLSLMETQKLSRFLMHQQRVVAGIEAAASDFLAHYGEAIQGTVPGAEGQSPMVVAIGSQRGFCGDFNESVAQTLRTRAAQSQARVVVVGRRLAARLGADARIAAVLDGPGVAEEVRPVLQRLMNTLSEFQALEGQTRPLAVSVLAHEDGESRLRMRGILLAHGVPDTARRFAYPPLLNLAPRQLFQDLSRHYLWAQMHHVFYGSLMAENRRRLQHMQSALQRLEEKSAELQRKDNVARQEEITEEIEVIMLSHEAVST